MNILRDGSRTEYSRLDRLVQFDERSRNFPAVDMLTAEEARAPRSRTWRVRHHLDQGSEGACVGFGFAHSAVASPRRDARFDKHTTAELERFARDELYHRAQHLDPWGGCYRGTACTQAASSTRYDGTSVLAGAKAAQDMSLVETYRWLFGEEQLWLGVSHLSHVIIGVNWYEGMFSTNRHGYIEATGRLAGGHCTVVYRNRVKTKYRTNEWYEIWNSWGASWGVRGTAKLSREHMAKLLAEDGEALVVIER